MAGYASPTSPLESLISTLGVEANKRARDQPDATRLNITFDVTFDTVDAHMRGLVGYDSFAATKSMRSGTWMAKRLAAPEEMSGKALRARRSYDTFPAPLDHLDAARSIAQLSSCMEQIEYHRFESDADCAFTLDKLKRCKEQSTVLANEFSALFALLAMHTEYSAQQKAPSPTGCKQCSLKEEELGSCRKQLDDLLHQNEALKCELKTQRERAEANDAALHLEEIQRQESKRCVLLMLHAQLKFYQKSNFMKIAPSTLSIDSVLHNGYAARNMIEFYRMLLEVPISERDVFVHLAAAFPAHVQLTDHTIHVTDMES